MSSFVFPSGGISNSLNTPNCSFFGDALDMNNLQIGPDSSPFFDQVPSFGMLMNSGATLSNVQSHSDVPDFATPSFQNATHSTPHNRLYDHTQNGSATASGIPEKSDSFPSESADIDLSMLCHDLGIKGTETVNTRSRTPERRGSQGKRNERRKTLSSEEMMSLIETHKKKSRYWYDKYKSAETARESLNRRLKRNLLEESKTEFQAISKTMREWETAFQKSRDHMMHSCRNVEKAFALLKESVLQKHLSRSASESTLAYERGDSSQHHQDSKRMNRERVAASAGSSTRAATCVSSRMMDPAGDRGTKTRSSLPTPAVTKQTLPTRSFSELLALASSQTAISSLNETPSRSSGGSKPSLKPISRLAMSKEQNSLSRKYLQVTKEIRESRTRAAAPSTSSKQASDGMKSCLSRGRTSVSGSNKSQKDVKGKVTSSR